MNTPISFFLMYRVIASLGSIIIFISVVGSVYLLRFEGTTLPAVFAICFLVLLIILSAALVVSIFMIRKSNRKTALPQSKNPADEYLRSLLDSSRIFIIRTDVRGNYMYANHAFLEMFVPENSRESLVGTPSLTYIIPEDHAKTIAAVEECFRHPGSTVSVTLRKPAIDGTMRLTEWDFFIITDREGLPVEFQCIGMDVTEQKKLEQKIQETEDNFQRLFLYSRDGMLETTPDGMILRANPAACTAFGRTEEELIGLGRYDLQDMMNEGERILAMVAEREQKGFVHGEVRFLRRDGTPFPIEGTSSLYAMADGTQRASVIFRDISAQKAMQEELRRSEELYRMIAENSLDLISLHIPNGGPFTYISPSVQKLLGYTPDELIGTLPLDLVHPDDKERVQPSNVQAFMREYPLEIVRIRLIHKDGSPRTFESRIVPIANPETGVFIAIQTIARDVSERIVLEEQIRSARDFYVSLVGAVNVVLWEAEPVTRRITYVSPKAKEMCGYEEEQWSSFNAFWHAHVHPEDRERVLSFVKEHIETKESYSVEYRFIKPDKTLIWINDVVTVVRENGNIMLFRGVMADVTEKKTMYDTIVQAHERLQLLLSSSPVPMGLNDTKGNITYLNPAFVETFGYTQEDIPDLEAWLETAYPDADYRAWIQESWQRRIAKAEAEKTAFEREEVLIRCKNNTTKTVITHAAPLQGSYVQGEHLVIFYDITERKQSEEVLKKSQENLKEAQRLAKIGSWEWDILANSITWSEEQYRLFGETPETFQTTYEGYLSHLSADEQLRTNALVTEALEGKAHYHIEHEITRRDGKIFFAIEQGNVVLDANGTPIRMYGTTQDITESKQAANTLLLSEQRYRSFIELQGTYFVQTNLEGKYTYASPSMLKDYTLGESVIGLSGLEHIIPEDHDVARNAVGRCLEQPGVPIWLILRKPHVSGKILTTEWKFIVITDSQGYPSEIQCVGHDITERVEAEQKIRTSEANLRAIMDSSIQAFWLIDRDLHVVAFNKNVELIVRDLFNKEVIAGKPILDYVVPSQKEEFIASARKALQGETIISEQDFLINNKIQWFELMYRPTSGQNNEIVGLTLCSTNITERKEQQESLRNINKFIRSLTNSLPSMVGYWTSDLVCTFANNAYIKYFRKQPEEIIGNTMQALLGEKLFAKNKPFVEAALEGNLQRFERDIQTPEGNIVSTLAQYIPDIAEDGSVRGFIALVTDISSIKEVEQKIRSSEANLRAIMDSSIQAFWLIDRDLQVIAYNRNVEHSVRLMLGKEAELGVSILEYVIPEQQKEFMEFVERALAGETIIHEQDFIINGEVCSGLKILDT